MSSMSSKAPVAQVLQQAMQAHRQGQFAEAEKFYASALKSDPNNADALHLFGALRLQQGDAQEAVRLIGAAVAQRPRDADILGNYAAALAAGGRFADALAAYDALASLPLPARVQALYGRGLMLTRLERFDEALQAFDAALASNARDPRLWFERGNALMSAGRHDDAVVSYDRAHELAPGQPEILSNRGYALFSLGAHVRALDSYDRALRTDPNSVTALSNRGNVLKALGRFDEALASYERVLALQPDHADTLNNCGALFFERDRPDDALRYFDQALQLRPNDVEFINHRGTALTHLARDGEALANAEHSLKIDSNNFDAHYYFLRHGRFAEGFRLYEKRWTSGKHGVPRPYQLPAWGGEAIDGPLLVWSEQGLGDQILFASLVGELSQRVRHMVLEVEPRLVAMFARSFPDVEVVAAKADLYVGPAVAQIGLTSLGGFFRADWASFPDRPAGFLRADPARVKAMRERVAGDRRAAIGLSWHSRKAKWGQFKSAELSHFTELLRAVDARWIDLQYGDTSAERADFAAASRMTLEHLDDVDNTNDIESLGALIAACDAVVSVSNTTVHLAGALGRPTWVLAPFGHSRMWYWHAEKPDNPWYPSVRVRPQRMGQTWSALVDEVTNEVSAFIETREDRA